MEDLYKIIDECNKAIERDPKDTDAYRNRAIAYYELKQYDEAISDLTVLIDLEPDNPNNFVFYGARSNAYILLNQYDAAISDLSRVIAFDPSNLVAYDQRGMAYGLKKQWDAAHADYSKIIDELDANNAQAYSARGFVNFRMEQYEATISDFNKAIELGSDDFNDYYFLGNAYIRTDQWKEAHDNLKKALEIDPEHKGAQASLKVVMEFPGVIEMLKSWSE